MRGHENLIRMRVEGLRPKIVFVNDYPCKTDWFDHKEHATVCTENDPLSSLDLRFLVGLRVSISATTESRAKALFERVKAAGAAVVAAVHVQHEKHHTAQSGWCEVFKKEVM